LLRASPITQWRARRSPCGLLTSCQAWQTSQLNRSRDGTGSTENWLSSNSTQCLRRLNQEPDVDEETQGEDVHGISFVLWDGTTVSFSWDPVPYVIEVENGIVFISQGEDETGIPTSSIKYSFEHKTNA
jgi:hypothetical protein